MRRTTTGPFGVPRADVEVDFDIEWDSDGFIYLWGLLVTEDRQTRVESVASWESLDHSCAARLAADAIGEMIAMRDEALAADTTYLVYHHSHPEISMINSLIAREAADLTGAQLPTAEEWAQFTADRFVDLRMIVSDNYIGLAGLGLKKVAPWAGFNWQEEEPSAEQTLLWIESARSRDDESERSANRERLLHYNTDNCLATLAVGNKLSTVKVEQRG